MLLIIHSYPPSWFLLFKSYSCFSYHYSKKKKWRRCIHNGFNQIRNYIKTLALLQGSREEPKDFPIKVFETIHVKKKQNLIWTEIETEDWILTPHSTHQDQEETKNWMSVNVAAPIANRSWYYTGCSLYIYQFPRIGSEPIIKTCWGCGWHHSIVSDKENFEVTLKLENNYLFDSNFCVS